MAFAEREVDEGFVRQAIRLAMSGRGRVEPNPMVGCVIAKESRVIGKGAHERFGGPHAEPNALTACTEDPRGATAYVTLEPCCHTEKKTPPCVPALIGAGIRRVVIGCADVNPAVNGRGIAQLRAAGIDVHSGVCEAESQQLIAPFIARMRYSRPYVTLKWAQSADGKVAGERGRRRQISNPRSMREIHELRGRCDAILVGINTALNDDPMLLARDVSIRRPLTRIVLDRDLRLACTSRLARTAREHPVIVYCSEQAVEQARVVSKALTNAGVQIATLPLDAGGMLSLGALRTALPLHVTHLLVEPGPTLARGFLSEGMADRVWVIRSPLVIGEVEAPTAITVPWPATGIVDLEGDMLSEFHNPRSDVFFAQASSADLELAAG